MAAAEVDLTIKRGTTWTLDFQWWQDQAKTTKVNTTGMVATLVARVKRSPTAALLFDLVTGEGPNTLSADGLFHFELSAAETADLPLGGAYDLNIADVGHADPVRALLTGQVGVEKNVPPEAGS